MMNPRQNNRFFSILYCSSQLFCAGAAESHPGAVDESFDAGVLTSDISYLAGGWGKVIGLALGPHDEIYIGGHFTDFLHPETGTKQWNGLARLHHDGTLDESFSVPVHDRNLTPHIDAHHIFVETNGTVWTGSFSYTEGFYPDGSRNSNKPPSYVSSDTIVTGHLLRSGKSLVLETLSSSPPGSGVLRRRNQDGTVDAAYSTPTFEATNGNRGLRLLLERANRQVYAAGDFTSVNGKAFPRLVRLNGNGSIDENFRPDTRLTSFGTNAATISTIALQANGKLFVAGAFSKSEPPFQAGIVRLNTDGSFDATFDPGTGATEGNDHPYWLAQVFNVAVQRDGKILVAGDFRKFNGIPRDGIVRLYGDPVQPLRLHSIDFISTDRVALELSGTADSIHLETSPALGGSWSRLGTFDMTNEVSTTVEVTQTSKRAGFFRVRRQ